MKHKKIKKIHTALEPFHSKNPLQWNEIFNYLTHAVNAYNERERKEWKHKSIFRRLFCHPAQYKVEVQAAKDFQMGNYKVACHRIWIKDTRSQRMRLDLLCVQDSRTSSEFIQDGVKYSKFALLAKDSCVKWMDKKCEFMYEILLFIQYYVS